MALRLVDCCRSTEAMSLYREYLKTQWSGLEEIRERQRKRLIRVVTHAFANVPYYREVFDRLSLSPDKIQSLEDLRKLPILDKEVIRSRQSDFLARDLKEYHPRRKATGGSTGRPLSYLLDKAARSSQWATMYRQWHIGGWRPGEKMVYLGGSSIFPSANDILKFIYVKLNNWIALSSFNMTGENMCNWLQMIRKSGVAYLHGYASSADLLATFADAHGFRDIRLKAVFTSAEALLPQYRQNLQRVFGCEVYDLYGANDGGGFAFECEVHKGLHCVSERAIMEIVDDRGNPVQPGQAGELVVTDLLNYSMPFIRYRVGDVATLGKAKCTCGRDLPMIGSIQGRSHDFVFTKKGARVHGEFFSHILRTRGWVDQFSVIQEENGDLVLLLKASSSKITAEVEGISNLLEQKFQGSHVSVVATQEMPVATSGKHRFVINKMLQGGTLSEV